MSWSKTWSRCHPDSTCGCKKFQLDTLGDHVMTCTTHSGTKKTHYWAVEQLADLFRTTRDQGQDKPSGPDPGSEVWRHRAGGLPHRRCGVCQSTSSWIRNTNESWGSSCNPRVLDIAPLTGYAGWQAGWDLLVVGCDLHAVVTNISRHLHCELVLILSSGNRPFSFRFRSWACATQPGPDAFPPRCFLLSAQS